eukprot:g17763.t1
MKDWSRKWCGERVLVGVTVTMMKGGKRKGIVKKKKDSCAVEVLVRHPYCSPGNVKFESHPERQRREKRLCMFLGILANILKHDSLVQSVVKAAGSYEALHEKLLQVTNVYLSSGTSRNRASVWVDQDTVPRDDVETTSSRNYVGIPRLELVRDLLEDLFTTAPSQAERAPLAAPCVTAIFELLKSFRYTSDVATSLTGIVLSVFVARSAVLRKAVVAVLNPELDQEHQHQQYAELLAEFCVDRSGEAHQPQLAANAMGLLALCLDDAQKLPLSERHLRPLVLQLSRQADCQSAASCRLLAKLLSEKFSTRKIVLDACREQYSLFVQSAKRALEQRTAARDVDDQRLFLALLQLGLLLDDALAGERRERAEQVAGILLNKGAPLLAGSGFPPTHPPSRVARRRAQFYELLDSAECVRFLTAEVLCETTHVEEVREVWRLLLRTSQTQDVQAVLADAICERNANLEQLRNLPRVDPEVVEQLEKKLAIAVGERDSFAQQVGQRTEQVHLLNSALQKASGELVRHAETLRELQRERAAHEATRQWIEGLEVEKQALQQDATDAQYGETKRGFPLLPLHPSASQSSPRRWRPAQYLPVWSWAVTIWSRHTQTLLQRLDFHAQRATENANSSLEQSLQEKNQLFAALQEAETRLKAAAEDRRGILAQNELLMAENDGLREEVEREKRNNVYAKAGMQRPEEAWAGLVPKFNEQPSKRRPQASSSAGGASYGGGAATGGGYGGAARAGTLHIGGGTREGTAGGGMSVAADLDAVRNTACARDDALISVSENVALVNHLAVQFFALARHAHLHRTLSPGALYTSVVFFRAFCAKKSLLEHNPETTFLCALLVGLKAEECLVTEDFVRRLLDELLGEKMGHDRGKMQKRWGEVVAEELPFVQTLDFNLVVEKPFALISLLEELWAEQQGAENPTEVDEQHGGGAGRQEEDPRPQVQESPHAGIVAAAKPQDVGRGKNVKKLPPETILSVAMLDEVLYLSVRLVAMGLFVAAGNELPGSVQKTLSKDEVPILGQLVGKIKQLPTKTASPEELQAVIGKRKRGLKKRKAADAGTNNTTKE